jgi:hypothetical protein
MYKRQDWQAYQLQVLKQLSVEFEVANIVLNVVLEATGVSRDMYEKSQMKYRMNRMCEDQLKQTLSALNRDMESRGLKRLESSLVKFDPEVMTREKTVEVMTYIEDQKLEVLSDLSNPFKAVREKEEVVVDLQVEQCKLDDAMFFKFGIEDPAVYKKAL